MSSNINRRDWLRNSTLAALGMGFSLRSMGNEEGLTRNFGANLNLLNLGSNENPYGISPKAKEALLGMLGEANRYQFNIASFSDCRKVIGTHFGVGDDQVLLTAGSGDALQMLARHFNKGNLVSAFPTFATLPNTAKNIGTKVIEVPLTADKKHDLPAMLTKITSETAMVYICNPANPSSTMIPPQQLEAFCVEASKKAAVIIDEAYIDFLDAPDNRSMIGLTHNNPNIIVVRTFSKIHAMAGLRMGFVITHPSTADALDKNIFRNSQITVNNLAMAAGLASLKDDAHRKSCKEKNKEAREFTFQALKSMNINCIPSYTNFLFFPLGNYQGDFAQNMLKRNVICRSNNYADGKWARVSVGTLDEMRQFMRIFKDEYKV
jgi:histidinol-phosphate aminotransferase